MDTKKLFHMVSANISRGVDLPKSIQIESFDDVMNYIQSQEGVPLFFSTFFLAGEEGRFATTSMAYIQNDDKMLGWSITTNVDASNKRILEYVTPENGKQFSMQFNDVLYLVVTEVEEDIINEKLSEGEVMEILRPSYEYLESLL